MINEMTTKKLVKLFDVINRILYELQYKLFIL